MSQFKGVAFASCLFEIHARAFSDSWTLDNFIKLLQLPSTLGWMNDKGFILISDLQECAEILTFAVLPEYQKQGIGTILMQEMLSWAKQHNKERIFLEVAADNTSALSLYKKMGFVETGKRPAYYKRGCHRIDALCMTYTLT